LDTVLGLSLTSTAVGWVLVEGRDADGAILDHDDFEVRTGGGMRAVNTSEQATAAVLSAQSLTTRDDQRLHVIGVTWSDEAAAEAALLLESLTDAGFDNVVPVRLHEASEMLARGIGPVVGYDKAAVCVLDGESATVVMVDTCDGEPQTAIKYLPGGNGRLVQWLTTMFDRSSWQPNGVVVVGAPEELDALSQRLEKALPVPVITQTGAQLALARGAALASAQSTLSDSDMVEHIDRKRLQHRGSRQQSYAGAMTMLVAGAVTFVASLSLAVGPRLVPDRAPGPVQHAVHKSATPPVAQAPAPPPAAVEVPAAKPPPEPPPAEEPSHEPAAAPAPAQPQAAVSMGPSAGLPAAEPVPPPAPPQPVPPPPPPEPNPHPLLTKLLERIHGHPNDPAPEQPAPGQAPPPNPGPPPP
jgi:hypothetical protein